YLGACVELGPEDIDPALIAAAKITYLEGYLFDPPRAQEAFRRAAAIAHRAGRQVALSLSDPFCVGRPRAAFRELVAGEVDIRFPSAERSAACAPPKSSAMSARGPRSRCPSLSGRRGRFKRSSSNSHISIPSMRHGRA